MPRLLVTTDPSTRAGTAVLLDEQVQAVPARAIGSVVTRTLGIGLPF